MTGDERNEDQPGTESASISDEERKDNPADNPTEKRDSDATEDEAWLNKKAIRKFFLATVVIGFVAAIMAFLLSVPSLSSTQIAGHVTTTTLTAELAEPTVIISNAKTQGLTLTGRIQARIPGVDGRRFEMLRFDADTEGQNLTVDQVSVPIGTTLTATHTAEHSPLELLFAQAQDTGEPVRIKISGIARVIANPEPDGPTVTHPVKGDAVVHLSPDDNAQFFIEPIARNLALAPRIKISDISFHYVRQTSNRVQELSGIREGRLYFEALAGREHQLQPVQKLDIDLTESGGTLLTTTVRPSDIETHFLASVDSLTAGATPNRRSLMPDWLAWLLAQQKFVVAIQVFGAVITAALGLITLSFVRDRLT